MKLKQIILSVTIFVTTLLSTNMDRGIKITFKEMKHEPRVALVIGNKNYTHFNSLNNPINDATDMANILRNKGFYVISLFDATQQQMEDAIVQFSNKIREGEGIGLVYYAGHGLEVRGVNYLIPTDSRIPSIDFIKSKAVSVDSIVSSMERAKNRFNILILDACRSNPFGRGGGGLAPINNAQGIFVAYATAPTKIAEDGAGRNGLFTKYLKKYINQNGLKIEEVFKRVGQEVQYESKGRQTPWVSSSIYGDFYFTLPFIQNTKKLVLLEPNKLFGYKWITPTDSVCRANGGKIDKYGICIANWESAGYICKASQANLPTLKELEKVIADYGGVVTSLFDAKNQKKNKNNSYYQESYKRKGFANTNNYWSEDRESINNGYEWIINFHSGYEIYNSKNTRNYVRCVRTGE